MTVFNHPKSQWNTLLHQRSWADLCDIDFVHVMEYGSIERVKFFFKSLTVHPFLCGTLNSHDSDLAQTVTKNVFSNWSHTNLHNLLVYLRTKPDDLPLLYRAILCHSNPNFKIPFDSPLFYYGVMQDHDLLAGLLEKTDRKDRSAVAQHLVLDIAPRYISNFDGNIFNFQRVNGSRKTLFHPATVECFPEYCDQAVQHTCNEIRKILGLKLSLKERVNHFAAHLWARWIEGKELDFPSPEKHNTMYEVQISYLEEFVEDHKECLTSQHLRNITDLFNQINKKHACDTSQTPLLNMYALKGCLEDAVQDIREQNVVEQTPAPPRRRM